MAGKIKDTKGLGIDAREQLGGLQQAHRRSRRHQNQHIDYTTVNPGILLSTIAAVVSRGCAIQFGRTKEGDAFVIRIVGDGEPYNDFIRPSEDINAYLEALSSDFTDSQ